MFPLPQSRHDALRVVKEVSALPHNTNTLSKLKGILGNALSYIEGWE